jgi:Ca-activated chloride channel family protein
MVHKIGAVQLKKATRLLCLLMLFTPGWGQTAAPSPAQASDQNQQAVTTLKVVTGLVAISAVVKSKDGEAQTGLTKEDFVLKQDGKEVPIRYFSRGSGLPLSFALMVDTSGSQETFIGDEALASDVFFETMLGRKEDRAMLVEFDSSVLLLKGMTNSASALHFAQARISERAAAKGGTLLYDAVYVVAKDVLAKETGRKAMVILSDGGDNGSRRTLLEAIEQAQRADVQVYSIVYSMRKSFSGADTGRSPEFDTGLGALEKLSESTGGHVFTVSQTMSLRDIFAEIADDLRLQYELAYKPPPDTQPNSYHKLELKAKDKKLIVQARKGFFEPP